MTYRTLRESRGVAEATKLVITTEPKGTEKITDKSLGWNGSSSHTDWPGSNAAFLLPSRRGTRKHSPSCRFFLHFALQVLHLHFQQQKTSTRKEYSHLEFKLYSETQYLNHTVVIVAMSFNENFQNIKIIIIIIILLSPSFKENFYL